MSLAYRPGDVANGHVLAADHRWYPLGSIPPAKRNRWHVAIAATAGVVAVALTVGAFMLPEPKYSSCEQWRNAYWTALYEVRDNDTPANVAKVEQILEDRPFDNCRAEDER